VVVVLMMGEPPSKESFGVPFGTLSFSQFGLPVLKWADSSSCPFYPPFLYFLPARTWTGTNLN